MKYYARKEGKTGKVTRVLKEGVSGPRSDYNAPTLYDSREDCLARLDLAIKNRKGWVIIGMKTVSIEELK